MNDKKLIIFVVEDDPGFNKMLTSYLVSKNKWEIRSFLTGEECLENLNLKPAIILQDYELPKMNGIEVLKKVKQILPETEFIFLSGQGDIKIAVETLRLGAFDYIVKDTHAKENALNKIDQITKILALLEFKRIHKKFQVIMFSLLILSWIAIALALLT